MKMTFYDRQDDTNPMNGMPINDEEGLLFCLVGNAKREPYFCELVGDNSRTLLIGIASNVGCVQYSNSNGDPPYLMATLGESDKDDDHVNFMISNTPTPVPSRYCIPFNALKQVALYFQKTGDKSPAVIWEEI